MKSVKLSPKTFILSPITVLPKLWRPLRLKKFGSVFLFLKLFILAPSPIFPITFPHFNNDTPPRELTLEIIQNMTDTEILGQVLMFGYEGEKPDPALIDWIEKNHLGSVKIFGRNANNLSQLSRTIAVYQEKAHKSRFGIPLLIATDQEGGLVRHVRGETSITLGNMAIGADGLPYSALQMGRLIGRELSNIGINMNFAPAVDIFLNPDSDIIGTRSFGEKPDWVGILGIAFAKGQQEYGIITTAKHFPGHGDTAMDSHGTLPEVNATIETLRKRDLVPYRLMIAAQVPAIMVGHLAFPEITGSLTPATLSYSLLTELLRKEMKFQGVTVTDDLVMYGVRSNGASMDEIAYRAMMAGSDLLLLSSSGPERTLLYSKLLYEMRSSQEFNRRVREAASRVIEMKIRWIGKTSSGSARHEKTEQPSPEGLLLEQAARSVTLIENQRFPLPASQAGNVLLIGGYKHFFSEGRRRYPQAKTFFIESSSLAKNKRIRERLLQVSRNFNSIIVLVTDQNMARMLNFLSSENEKIIVFSIFSPTSLKNMPWVKTSLALYGASQEVFRAAYAALAGDFIPKGRLPISLKKLPSSEE